ncbi:hypothetical protein M885DRAFT_314629 [Pelagophyceae sp. CCMP2097]|nr:hypothetical protein M885DRAFT_314629 [Pelagophyceae sp. CCMP2097]
MLSAFVALVLQAGLCAGFSPGSHARRRPSRTGAAPRAAAASLDALPAPLRAIVESLASLPDDKYRYKQLLFMAGDCDPIADALKTPENKVPGCLSTVHVAATLDDGKVYYTGDSDGQLTKGLLTMLVKGLSGATPAQIGEVKPDFIRDAGIAASLTPGRNNGFVNMLAVMQKKAQALLDAPAADDAGGQGKLAAAMLEILACLKPEALELVDESGGAETDFKLTIVTASFDGFEVEMRQRVIETLLADLIPRCESFRILALTPEER